jgi:uncharacterized protein YbjT (DUF2867 family)
MILVAGGTGTLGTQVIHGLIAEGRAVRVLTRNADRARQGLPSSVEIVQGDIRDSSAVTRSVSGCTTVVSAITGFGGPGAAGAWAIDRDGNHVLIAAARDEGVAHLVLLSVVQAAPDHRIGLFRAKFAAEQELMASGLGWTIIRATAYMETWVGLVGGPLVETGKTRIFGRGVNPINFVSAHDVATLVRRAIDDPALRNTVVEIGGPEDLSLDQMARCVEAVTRRTGVINHVPLPMMRALSVLMRPIKPVLADQIAAAVVMDTTDMRFDSSAARGRFPTLPSTTLEAMIRRDYPAT